MVYSPGEATSARLCDQTRVCVNASDTGYASYMSHHKLKDKKTKKLIHCWKAWLVDANQTEAAQWKR